MRANQLSIVNYVLSHTHAPTKSGQERATRNVQLGVILILKLYVYEKRGIG